MLNGNGVNIMIKNFFDLEFIVRGIVKERFGMRVSGFSIFECPRYVIPDIDISNTDTISLLECILLAKRIGDSNDWLINYGESQKAILKINPIMSTVDNNIIGHEIILINKVD